MERVIRRSLLLCFAAAFFVSCGTRESAVRAAESPHYSAATIRPNGHQGSAPLAPGMLVSIYGSSLGPATPCTGRPDSTRRHTPAAARPHQATPELQVFPETLCGVEVFVSNRRAGLLYVAHDQVNFQVPQDVPPNATATVRLAYDGTEGSEATLPFGVEPNFEPAETLARRMFEGWQAIEWNSVYDGDSRCQEVRARSGGLRGALYDHAIYCSEARGDTIAEWFYYPVDGDPPTFRLQRADFRLRAHYPAMSGEVEALLRASMTGAFGASEPANVFEIGAHPGVGWRTPAASVFLHANRHHVDPAGVSQGIRLVALLPERLEAREDPVEPRDGECADCDGPLCYRRIAEGPRSTAYARARAYETWWAMSQLAPDDESVIDASPPREEGERARQRALELYEEIVRSEPDSEAARYARGVIPRLKLGLGTGSRYGYCVIL